jgi:ribosomal protein L24E
MSSIRTICSFCGKKFSRTIGRTNETKRFEWKSFCSPKCLSAARLKGRFLICSNPTCKKKFYRSLGRINNKGLNFCSIPCSSKINNSRYPKRIAQTKKCLYCKRSFIAREGKVYCSSKCKHESQIITNKEITNGIKNFYKEEERIPFKKEFPHYSAAQKRFGSWNNAIEAAGFEPNPAMFAKKHVAKDGHKCDSLAEKIIDDWLYAKEIIHKRSIPYPDDNSLTADFGINGKLIEFFGLAGQLKEYDRLIKKKKMICKKHHIPLIEIYPKDILPINRLTNILFQKK